MEKGTTSKQLAEFCVTTQLNDIPPPMVKKMKFHILDTLGAGIAGARSDELTKLLKVFHKTEFSGQVPLWGAGKKATVRNAATANAMACHTFELDDTGGCDHSGAVVVPAALACLSLCGRKVSGPEFITAIVLGYDIARRALEACGAYAPHNEAGWHSTSTCGTFGAAAAAGYLLRLTPTQMQYALGLAASTSCGLWAFIHDNSQSKRLHPGRAAEGGLFSAMLAQEDFRGPTMVFDDVWGGFAKTFSPNSTDLEAWTRALGTNWKIDRVSIKPHASCRSTHAAVDAVAELIKSNSMAPSEIVRIHIRLNSFVNGMCGGRDRSTMPGTQMSMPYAVAARIVYGSAELGSYLEESRKDERITEVMNRIILEVDEKMPSNEEPVVTITTKNGSSYESQVHIALGSPANPLSDSEVIAKYTNLGLLVWEQQTVDALSRMILELEYVADMEDINNILATKPHTTTIIE